MLAFQHEGTGLTVLAKVIEEKTGVSTDVALTEKADLSSDNLMVYTGGFTPVNDGWHFIHYEAKLISRTIATSVSRFMALVVLETQPGALGARSNAKKDADGNTVTEKQVTMSSSVAGVTGVITIKVGGS